MKLFVFAIGARDRASSRWRIWDHIDWLREQGHEVRVDSLSAQGVKNADIGFLARLIWRYPLWLFHFFWSDAVIVQESTELWPAVLLRNVGKRRRLIFDFSDPIDRIGSGFKHRMRRKMFDIFVRHADAIIVENGAYLELLRTYGQKCFHFYGPVDATRFRESVDKLGRRIPNKGPFRIGWTGSHGTYRFIRPLLPIIDELGRERDIEVVLIGVNSIDYDFKFARATTVEFDEAADFRIVPTFDLGLFRLEDNEDALWRGAGKLFLYMAAGTPFIATDRGIGGALMREANVGFPVEQEGDWPDVLRHAIAASEARVSMTEQSLVFATEQLSYEQYRQHLRAHLTDSTGSSSKR